MTKKELRGTIYDNTCMTKEEIDKIKSMERGNLPNITNEESGSNSQPDPDSSFSLSEINNPSSLTVPSTSLKRRTKLHEVPERKCNEKLNYYCNSFRIEKEMGTFFIDTDPKDNSKKWTGLFLQPYKKNNEEITISATDDIGSSYQAYRRKKMFLKKCPFCIGDLEFNQ